MRHLSVCSPHIAWNPRTSSQTAMLLSNRGVISCPRKLMCVIKILGCLNSENPTWERLPVKSECFDCFWLLGNYCK